MNTINVFYLPSGKRFKKAVTNCKGDVYLRMPEGTYRNLKKDSSLMSFISSLTFQQVDFNLSYSEPDDTSILFGALA